LAPQSLYAKQLSEIENLDEIIVKEIEKICKVATYILGYLVLLRSEYGAK
jgi:hypothetical protein